MPQTVSGRTLTTEYLESALRGLDVLLKATRFYPPAHPALKTAIEQTLLKFAPLLMGRESIVFSVHKEGFRVDDTLVSADRLVLKNFATQLFARHVRTLLVLADLTSRDLCAFAQCLSQDAPEIQQKGGAQAMLREAGVSTIWVNEIDLANILTRKDEIENQREENQEMGLDDTTEERAEDGERAPVAIELPADNRSLETLLRELERTESDHHFRVLAQDIPPLILVNLSDVGAPLVIRALLLLCRYATDPQLSLTRRQIARDTLSGLVRDEIIDFLIYTLCHKNSGRESRERLMSLVVCFAGKIEQHLMRHLAAESDSQSRKILGAALVRLGPTATPVLTGYLKDSRWFVVRNVMVILGEIRSQETTEQIVPLLEHEDVRVRRETLRALTKIGGRGAETTLVRVLECADQEMRRQAILSLGALKSTVALPPLLELATRKDSKGRYLEEKKDAITTLGLIGSSDAILHLRSILRRRRFWFTSNNDDLREAAATALGKIGGPEALTLLREATEDRSEQVARAARLALNRIEKTTSHAT